MTVFTGSLLKYSTQWVSKHSHTLVTVTLFETILQRYTPEELECLPGFYKSLDGLKQYMGKLLAAIIPVRFNILTPWSIDFNAECNVIFLGTN